MPSLASDMGFSGAGMALRLQRCIEARSWQTTVGRRRNKEEISAFAQRRDCERLLACLLDVRPLSKHSSPYWPLLEAKTAAGAAFRLMVHLVDVRRTT